MACEAGSKWKHSRRPRLFHGYHLDSCIQSKVSILRGILISRVKLHARTAGEIKVLISGVSLERLCYAAGSTHVPQSRAIFEVKKSTGQESSQAVSQPPTEEQGKEKEILSITIFRELRGSSEVVIFLSPSPVRGMW